MRSSSILMPRRDAFAIARTVPACHSVIDAAWAFETTKGADQYSGERTDNSQFPSGRSIVSLPGTLIVRSIVESLPTCFAVSCASTARSPEFP